MPAFVRRAALLVAVIVALPVVADDLQKKTDLPPPAAAPRSAGQIVAELSKVTPSAVTVKLPEAERGKYSSGSRGRPRVQVAYKDHDFNLAADVKVRWHDLPKGPDGKAKQYTNAEYQKLIEPAGTPGFKAAMSDLHEGQTVRLYLTRSGKDDPPVVATIMILGEAKRLAAAGKNDGKLKK
jgi:hypothetical protein